MTTGFRRILAGACLGSLLLSTPSWAGGGVPPDGFQNGAPAFRAGKWVEAAAAFEWIAGSKTLVPDHALFMAGQSRLALGDTNRSRAHFAALVAGFPASIRFGAACAALGEMDLGTGDLPGAEAKLLLATNDRDEGVTLRARLTLAEVAIRTARPLLAAEHWNRVREQAPLSPEAALARMRLREARVCHGALALRGGELLKEARRLFPEKQYKTIAAMVGPRGLSMPDMSAAWLDLWADTQVKLGDRLGALETLTKLETRATNTAHLLEIRFKRANLFWNMDRDDDALAAFESCLDSAGYARADEAVYAIGRIHEQYQRTNDAIACFRKLTGMKGPRELAAEARWRIGWVHWKRANWPTAARAFGEAARAEGRPGMATWWHGRALAKSGRMAEARSCLERVFAADPTGLYGHWAAWGMGKIPARPAPLFRTATILPPEPWPWELPTGADAFHGRRAEALFRSGFLDLAARELSAMDRASPAGVELDRYLVRTYLAVNAIPDARRVAWRGGSGLNLGPDEHRVLSYPLAYAAEIGRAARANQVDPCLIFGLIRQESAFDPRALSHADARGLMQLLPFTASRVVGTEDVDLFDPSVNIDLGTRFLSKLLSSYRGDEIQSLAAYNGNERAVARWHPWLPICDEDEFVEGITWPETRDYVKQVTSHARMYRRLMDDAAP